ncbi:MAG: hypothetical protein PHI85_00440 [Victivallaceae bacterium]|nr:hypothetical protein [Victivallaceae bacterium]
MLKRLLAFVKNALIINIALIFFYSIKNQLSSASYFESFNKIAEAGGFVNINYVIWPIAATMPAFCIRRSKSLNTSRAESGRPATQPEAAEKPLTCIFPNTLYFKGQHKG